MKLQKVFILAGLVLTTYISGSVLTILFEEYYDAVTSIQSKNMIQLYSNRPPVKGTPIDIRNIPIQIFKDGYENSRKLPYTDDYTVLFRDKHNIARPIVYNGHNIIQLEYAPLGSPRNGEQRLGFYYRLQDFSASDIALVIFNVDTGETKEVYVGGFKTSTWEWDGDHQVIVYYGCGTACMYAYKIDVDTGKEVEGYHVITQEQTVI